MTITRKDLERATQRAQSLLLSLRSPQGYWEGRLASSPLATGVALTALDPVDLPPQRMRAAFEWLTKAQHANGGWGDTRSSRANLAATLLVLCADARHQGLTELSRQCAQNFVEQRGGFVEGLSRIYGADLTFQVPIRMAGACSGLVDWSDVDPLPLELATAPRSVMGVLGLPVVSYALPALVCVGLARHRQSPSSLPLAALREKVATAALQVIREMQPPGGGYLEAIPITAFCLMALKAAGCGTHPIAQDAKRFLLSTQRENGPWPVEVNLSTWNTTRAIEALGDGVTSPETSRAWLLKQQTTTPCVYSNAAPGGWGWNHLPGSVPDADDTAGALLALKLLGVGISPEVEKGLAWLLRLQNSNGGWPTFCRGWEKLPFDRSAPDLTAHVLRAFAAWNNGSKNNLSSAIDDATASGWKFLQDQQRPDGSFAPLWFGCEFAPDQINATYGTCQVLQACAADGRHPAELRKRAQKFLLSLQNADGSFGGCSGAPGTVEETGLALKALCAHGWTFDTPQAQRAARWLTDHQHRDGWWDPSAIGFYFAVLWYHEELYPLCYGLGGLRALCAS